MEQQQDAIWKMVLGDRVQLGRLVYTRVPGGWILTETGSNASQGMTFVPFSNEFNPMKEKAKPKSTKFIPPTVQEVQDYCRQKGYSIDAESFVNFYNSKGWVVGKTKMKQWTSAVANWAKRRTDERHNRSYTSKSERADQATRDFLQSLS